MIVCTYNRKYSTDNQVATCDLLQFKNNSNQYEPELKILTEKPLLINNKLIEDSKIDPIQDNKERLSDKRDFDDVTLLAYPETGKAVVCYHRYCQSLEYLNNQPTKKPTSSPSLSPTIAPTNIPTISPSKSPSKSPTISPSASPSLSPTNMPTSSPSLSPTNIPTISPTRSPTLSPTKYCKEGYWVDPISSEWRCEPCPRGKFQPYSNQHGVKSCIDCTKGHICPSDGTTKPLPCKKGSYNNKNGGKNANDCKKCPAGSYCPNQKSNNNNNTIVFSDGPIDPVPCNKGTYAQLASSMSNECEKCPIIANCLGGDGCADGYSGSMCGFCVCQTNKPAV